MNLKNICDRRVIKMKIFSFKCQRTKYKVLCCTLTTEYTAHLIHSFCCSEWASHTSGRIFIMPSGLGHCRGSAMKAMTGRGDNDTSVQPQTHAMGAVTREPRDGGIPILHKPTIVRCVPCRRVSWINNGKFVKRLILLQ